MFSFPFEERERGRERPRNVRAGIRLSRLFLTFSLFGESFFFGENCTQGNTHREANLFSKCQLIALRTRSLGGLSPRSVCSCTFGEFTTLLLPRVWAGEARDQRCNTSSASGSVAGRANALCKTMSASF